MSAGRSRYGNAPKLVIPFVIVVLLLAWLRGDLNKPPAPSKDDGGLATCASWRGATHEERSKALTIINEGQTNTVDEMSVTWLCQGKILGTTNNRTCFGNESGQVKDQIYCIRLYYPNGTQPQFVP